MANENLIVARFFVHTVHNEAKSREAGRPIFDDMECVEIRMAANKQTVVVSPAHEVSRRERNLQTGDMTDITYAMVYNEQYKKFKQGLTQDQSGTPLSELPFLSASKRLELKALNIHTAEALASLDGPPLKMLGMGGRELKNQAQAYLDKAGGSVDVVKMAAKMAEMQAMIDRLTSSASEAPAPATSPFFDMEAEDIRNWIEANGGPKQRANASHSTLVKVADTLNAELAQKAAAA
jgi:hypothetical protein